MQVNRKDPAEGLAEGYSLAKPEYEAFRAELVAKARAQYHPVQRDTLPEYYIVKARCMEFSNAFVEKFPELRTERGWINSQEREAKGWSAGEHWWCVDPEGNIVDPSLNQFAFWREPEKLVYKVFNPETDVIYIGRCHNCGDPIYGLEAQGPAYMCFPEEGEEESYCARTYNPL